MRADERGLDATGERGDEGVRRGTALGDREDLLELVEHDRERRAQRRGGRVDRLRERVVELDHRIARLGLRRGSQLVRVLRGLAGHGGDEAGDRVVLPIVKDDRHESRGAVSADVAPRELVEARDDAGPQQRAFAHPALGVEQRQAGGSQVGDDDVALIRAPEEPLGLLLGVEVQSAERGLTGTLGRRLAVGVPGRGHRPRNRSCQSKDRNQLGSQGVDVIARPRPEQRDLALADRAPQLAFEGVGTVGDRP